MLLHWHVKELYSSWGLLSFRRTPLYYIYRDFEIREMSEGGRNDVGGRWGGVILIFSTSHHKQLDIILE